MNKKNAFTMAEALIVLAIVGVLASISVVVTSKAKPDENIIMYRKAYKATVSAIQNMLNDTTLYPNANMPISSSQLGGTFSNKKGLCDNTTGNNSFAKNFRNQLSPISAETDKNATIQKFTTADGLYWEVRGGLTCDSYAYVKVNINGKDGTACPYPTCGQPTQFCFRIEHTGKMKPVSARENISEGCGTFDPVAAAYIHYNKINKHSQIPNGGTWSQD